MSVPGMSPSLAPSDSSELFGRHHYVPSEGTPLLAGQPTHHDGQPLRARQSDTASARSRRSLSSTRSTKSGRRWASMVAMTILGLLVLVTMITIFWVPAAIEEYAKEAAVVEPTNLSLESITVHGVQARIRANFRLDGRRVRNERVRCVGRVITWVVGSLGIEDTTLRVYLPDYGNVLLGTAVVPRMAIELKDGHNNAIDFVANLKADAEGIRMIANEFFEGRLKLLRLQGKADLHLRAGPIPLGTHVVSELLTFEGKTIPALPEYNITKLLFHETPLPGYDNRAMAAEVLVTSFNDHQFSVDIPRLDFHILVPGCNLFGPHVILADAHTNPVAVRPLAPVTTEVLGLVRELGDDLTRACPKTRSSPLENLLRTYLDGENATVFVRGKRSSASDLPGWLDDILSTLELPVPLPGKLTDKLIRNFSLTDVDFQLEDEPKVSGTIQVLAALPAEMDFDLNVTGVKANADVYFLSKKLGELRPRRWEKANSTRIATDDQGQDMLKIESRIMDVPLNVTDGDVLAEVVKRLFYDAEDVLLDVDARVAVQVQTILGQLELKDIPAQGKIPVKLLPGNTIGSLNPKVGNVEVIDSSSGSVVLRAAINITNPTSYTAYVPSVNIHLLCNGSLLGEASASNLRITTGRNVNLLVAAIWNPIRGGEEGVRKGREMLSQFISGFRPTITLKTHRDSIPGQPLIGQALSWLNLSAQTPPVGLPGEGEDDDDRSRLIQDATFHLFSSSATFTLFSPLQHNTIYIDHINGTALYNHSEPVGRVGYDYPFAIPPGESQTPRLPVEWSLGSVGYEKMKEAVGGQLKLDASATVGVRLGAWSENIWFRGQGIGAHVRI